MMMILIVADRGGRCLCTLRPCPVTWWSRLKLWWIWWRWLWYDFYRTQVNLGSDLWVRMSVRPSVTDVCKDLTDVTLADEDTNSIPTDNADMAIQGNVAMQWCNLVANFRTNARRATSCPNVEPMQIKVAQFATDWSGSFWWPDLQSAQVAPPGGQNCNQWMRHHISYGGKISYLQMTCGAI